MSLSSQVHLSETTLQFLKEGEFEVTPGDGGSRDPFLKEKEVVTYLIAQDGRGHVEPSQEAIKIGQLNT